VTDTGPGMTQQQRHAAFDRFWRSTENNKPGGSGLGLAIARKLVDADRGTIRLDANQPHGIDATISYPNPTPK
jgi:signal transduction histidine kinase